MYLTSSLDSTGLKSKTHYIVLHYDDQRELIELPKSYSDLKSQVQELFHFNDAFQIETKELNICDGEWIRIPEGLWSGLAELLGNVYIVPRGGRRASQFQPQSAPEAAMSVIESEPGSDPKPTSVHTGNEGVINLSAPLVENEFVVINIGKIDFDVESTPSAKLTIQLLDDKMNSALSISFSPSDGSTSFTSSTNESNSICALKQAFPRDTDNYIFIHKNKMRFKLVYDIHLIGTIAAPAHYPLAHVSYDLGSHSPFKGPVSANIYSSASHLQDSFVPYLTMFPSFKKASVRKQILDSDSLVATTMSNIREETRSFNSSTSGIKYFSKDLLPGPSTKIEWVLSQQSIFVVSYHLPEDTTKVLEIRFYDTAAVSEMILQIHIHPTIVQFALEKFWGDSNFSVFHTIGLESPIMHTAGDHSVALLNVGGKVHISFDFKQLTVLPKNSVIKQEPDKLTVDIPTCTSARLDVYQF